MGPVTDGRAGRPDHHDRIGFVGAGQLGGPMIERLLGAGHEVRVLARRAEVTSEWTARGVPTAAGAAELAAGSDVVIVCVYDGEQLRDLVLGDGGLAEAVTPGAVVLSHTTGGIGVVDEVARALQGRGVGFVDAPVSGTADDIRRGELTVLLGGADEAVDRVDPILSAYCSRRPRTGAAGTATRLKLINNLWFAVNVQLTGLAVDLAGEFDVDERTLIECISHCSANSAALGYVRRFGSVDKLAEQVGRYLRKDVAAVRESAREAGVDLGLLGRLATAGPLEALHP